MAGTDHLPAKPRDEPDEADLERVLKFVPRGAAALAGVAVALIIVGWLLIYFLVFLPRGPVH